MVPLSLLELTQTDLIIGQNNLFKQLYYDQEILQEKGVHYQLDLMKTQTAQKKAKLNINIRQ